MHRIRNRRISLYDMACSEEDYDLLVPGTKIQVTGYKSEWSGEVEIIDATFEFVDDGDTYIAEPLDVTEMLGTDELISHQNELVSFTGMTVEAAGQDENGNDVAFLYNLMVPAHRVMMYTLTYPTMAKHTPLLLNPISATAPAMYTKLLKPLKSDRPSIWKASCTGMKALILILLPLLLQNNLSRSSCYM